MVVDTNIDYLGMTEEDFDNSERRVPVYAISNMLTPTQLAQVEEGDLIKVSLLTPVQVDEVNAALEFDNNLAQVGHQVKTDIHKYL